MKVVITSYGKGAASTKERHIGHLCGYTQHEDVPMCSVTQSCPTLCDPMDCNPPGSSVHGIVQARTLEWVAISSPRGSSWPKDWTHVSCISCIDRWIFFFFFLPLSHLGSPTWRWGKSKDEHSRQRGNKHVIWSEFFYFWGAVCFLVLLPVVDSSKQQNTKWELGSDQDNMNYGHQCLK